MTRHRELPLHTREEFDFIASAPLEVAWQLFGAEGERAWADDWHPVFVWPTVPADQYGMVFTVAHGYQTAVWVNTCFDRAATRIQYVNFLPHAYVTVITLALRPTGQATQVEVVYERTALTPTANETVQRLAANDKALGAHWCRQINQHLNHRS
ncbi:MAG: hypothetical protein M3O26_20340 [Pseudomonadota bacterium]|nr:hypothetical protein [Pseudomonadota bacterium]